MFQSNRIARRGFSLLEVLVSTAVLSMVLLCVALVTKTGNGVFRASQARDALRQQGQHALDRVVDAISTASKSTFTPNPVGPFGSSTLDFQTPTGIKNGVISWGPKTRICFQLAPKGQGGEEQGEDHHGHVQTLPNDGEVVLIRNVGTASAVTTVLATHVTENLEGETANGKDDNGNGLVDEKGLSIVLNGDQLTVRMTVADIDPDGKAVWVTTQTQVRLRN